MMSVSVKGLKERIDALAQITETLEREVRLELEKAGAAMTEDARRDHRFKTRSGNLERSIDFDVPDDGTVLKFGLVNDVTTANWKKAPHVTYGTFQHEGTKEGYYQSKAAGSYTPSPGKGGIEADHFIVRAWDKHVYGMLERLKSKVLNAIKKAAENGVF